MHSINAKNFVRDILEYILMFIIFLYGQSVWIRMMPEGYYTYMSLIFCLVVLFLLIISGKIYISDVKKIFAVTAYLGIYIIITIESSYLYIVLFRLYFPLVLLIAYLGVVYRDGRILDFLRKFSDIVIVFAAISFVFYILGTVMNVIPYTIDTYTWRGRTTYTKNYFHLMYEAQEEPFMGVTLIRNCGIFAEAPSYAVPLCYSFFYELFVRKQGRQISIVVLVVTCISTWSTKAMCIFLCIIALKVISRVFVAQKSRGINVFIRLLAPFVLAILAIIAFVVLNNKSLQNAFLTRMDDIFSCFKAFRDNVIFGVGIQNESAIYEYFTYRSSNYNGISVGIPALLAEGGVYLVMMYIYSLINAIRTADNKEITIYFIIIEILIFAFSNIPFFLSTTFVLAMGIASCKNK